MGAASGSGLGADYRRKWQTKLNFVGAKYVAIKRNQLLGDKKNIGKF